MDELERTIRGRLRQPEFPVPDAVDAAILGMAADAAAGFRRRRRLRLIRVGSVAAAAMLVVGLWLATRVGTPSERAFDVVDAWRVSAGMERDEGRFDLDRDGRVDRGDAELMLRQIVAIEPRRKS